MNLPQPKYHLQTKEFDGQLKVLCLIRNAYMVLTPEEWVRQHILHYLIEEKGYNRNFISVEKAVLVNGKKKRFDILIYDKAHAPFLIVECKALDKTVNQATLDQAGRYNMALAAPYLLVSNWDKWIMAKIDQKKGTFSFLDNVPAFIEVKD